MLVAGLIAVSIKDGKLLQAAEQTRRQFSRPLQKGRERPIAVQLLGGMIIWATTLYCGPKKQRFRKDDAPRVGLDITLAQFGFGKAVSPGLQTRVARQMALCPSIAFAQKEIARQGVDLNMKAIMRLLNRRMPMVCLAVMSQGDPKRSLGELLRRIGENPS